MQTALGFLGSYVGGVLISSYRADGSSTQRICRALSRGMPPAIGSASRPMKSSETNANWSHWMP